MEEIKTEDAFFARIASFRGEVVVAIDIGATHTRIAVVPCAAAEGGGVFFKYRVFDVKSLTDVMESFTSKVSMTSKATCIAAPGPHYKGVVGPMANFSGTVKTFRVTDFPPRMFPRQRTAVLNDLESLGHSVLRCAATGRLSKYFTVYMPSASRPESNQTNALVDGHYLVIAPGTGLGVCIVYFDPMKGQKGVLPSEFGHITVSQRTYKAFPEVLQYLETKCEGRALEWDDTVSGRGLAATYTSLTGETLGTDVISTKAIRGECPQCFKALLLHYELLFHFAGELAAGFVPAGVIIAGENAAKNMAFLTQPAVKERLQRVYLSHGMERYKFLSNAVVLMQSSSANLNLIGCEGIAMGLIEPRASKL